MTVHIRAELAGVAGKVVSACGIRVPAMVRPGDREHRPPPRVDGVASATRACHASLPELDRRGDAGATGIRSARTIRRGRSVSRREDLWHVRRTVQAAHSQVGKVKDDQA